PEERVEALAQLTLEVRRQHLLRDAFLGARSLEIRGELLKEYLHQAERRNVEVVDDEHHEFPAPRGHDAEKDPVPLAVVVQDGEGWLRELPRDLVGRGDDRGAERGGRHHVHRAGEAVLGHHLAGRGHDQHEWRTRLLHERDHRLDRPRFHGARRHPTASAARSSSRRTSPTFTSVPATATIKTPDGAGTTSRLPWSHCRCQNRLAPRPAASIARRSRDAKLAASAATATPLIPSISCSATTSPSSPDTSIAPRTPRTRVTRSSAGP